MSYPYRMRALAMAAALFACPVHAAETSADEALVSERLSSRALSVLDGMLGPGRARVLVEVRGERLQIRTETELLTPIVEGLGKAASPTPAETSRTILEALRLLDLPGYYKSPTDDERRSAADKIAAATPAAPAVPQAFQKDFEHSLRDAGFEIKKIEATVVLDAALSDAEAREAAQILPQLLRIDNSRGDALSIVRAPMLPAWKTAFSTPSDWRKLSYIGAGLLGALVVVSILAASMVRAARVFARELTSALPRREGVPGLDAGPGEALPELMPGAPPGLIDAAAGPDGPLPGAEAVPALGRRFDFLETADAAAAGRILSEETPADLAQIFAYLAKTAPDAASRLFARLPTEIQAVTSAAMLKLKAVDPNRLAEIEDRLKVMVANGLKGSERLAMILSRVPGDDRAMLLGRLASQEDSRSVAEIERQLFSFEDFGALSPADLRRVMGAVPYELWGMALRGAPVSLINSVLSELPEGPRGLVREEAANPQPKDKVVAARSKILDTFLELAAKGQVKLDQGSGVEETL